jgi:hypothetical protein
MTDAKKTKDKEKALQEYEQKKARVRQEHIDIIGKKPEDQL